MRGLARVAICGAVLLAAWAAPARAEGPNYTYVEGGYINVDVNDLQDTGDSYFVDGSLGGKWWHLTAYYQNGDLGPDYSQNVWRIGLGWHGLLGKKADVIGEAAYLDVTTDGPGFKDSDNGYGITGGVRWVPFKLLELAGFGHYTDVGSDSETTWEGRAIINIWRLGFGAAYEKFDGGDQWDAFARFNFGKR
jgi:hypothetical protein